MYGNDANGELGSEYSNGAAVASGTQYVDWLSGRSEKAGLFLGEDLGNCSKRM